MNKMFSHCMCVLKLVLGMGYNNSAVASPVHGPFRIVKNGSPSLRLQIVFVLKPCTILSVGQN